MPIAIPDEPERSDLAPAQGPLRLRYEDVAQSGDLVLETVPHALGLVWQQHMAPLPATPVLQRDGIIPILTHLVVIGGPGPIAVGPPMSATGTHRFAHTVGASGAVDRLLLDIWARVTAPRGRTYGPAPEGAGEPLLVGRVFARHVLSRIWAPPGRRKVVAVEAPGLPPVPLARAAWTPLPSIADPPPAAVALDAGFAVDPAPIVFGRMHTDSNVHVNSLVYPRLFEEAVVRRLAALGRSTDVLSRAVEIGYRKPCFVGDSVRVVLRTFEVERAAGSNDLAAIVAVGAFVAQGDAGALAGTTATPERVHAYLRMRLEP